MNRIQMSLFNIFALILIILVSTDIYLSMKSRELSTQINGMQNVIMNAGKVEPILTNITVEIAKNAPNDRRLKEILEKHQLKVDFKKQPAEKKE
jgi:hypothetical protein